VVVGAGYTGTEVAAQGVLYTDGLHVRLECTTMQHPGPRP
jgi:hypothetical protein